MALRDPGWAAMVAEVAPGASVRRVRRLGGGLATETFTVGTTDGAFVVKRYRPGDRTAPVEWDRLHFAQRVNLPVPHPVALDVEGRWFNTPTLVMIRLPGRPDVQPTHVDGWLQQLAQALVTIHSTDTTGADGPLRRPSPVETWKPPDLAHPSLLTDRAVATILHNLPGASWPPVLVHGDFHPGNTLWSRSQLAGIVDWSKCRVGPRWYELAYCRADIAFLLGLSYAQRLTYHYVDITGTKPVDLPLFDLICGLNARRWGHLWLTAYRQQGSTNTLRQAMARVTSFLRHSLAEIT